MPGVCVIRWAAIRGPTAALERLNPQNDRACAKSCSGSTEPAGARPRGCQTCGLKTEGDEFLGFAFMSGNRVMAGSRQGAKSGWNR